MQFLTMQLYSSGSWNDSDYVFEHLLENFKMATYE